MTEIPPTIYPTEVPKKRGRGRPRNPYRTVGNGEVHGIGKHEYGSHANTLMKMRDFCLGKMKHCNYDVADILLEIAVGYKTVKPSDRLKSVEILLSYGLGKPRERVEIVDAKSYDSFDHEKAVERWKTLLSFLDSKRVVDAEPEGDREGVL